MSGFSLNLTFWWSIPLSRSLLHFWGSSNFPLYRINIRLYGVSEDPNFRKEIRQLRSPDIGKLLSITGIIRKNTEVLPRLQKAAFVCSVCGELTYVDQERGKLDEPQKCSNDLESFIISCSSSVEIFTSSSSFDFL